MAAKTRPALILSDYPTDEELALLIVVPHTTAVRDNLWELNLPKTFLKPGVFHLQQIQPVPLMCFDFRLGALTQDEFRQLKAALVRLLSKRESSSARHKRARARMIIQPLDRLVGVL